MECPDALVLLGDITPARPLTEELFDVLNRVHVYWILGNHDTDDVHCYDNLLGFEHPNLKHIGSRVVTVKGRDGSSIRLAGLDGVFRGKIWMPTLEELTEEKSASNRLSVEDYVARMGKGNRWRNGLPLRHRSTIFPETFDQVAQLSTDILVTHEAPSPNEMGFPALEWLAHKMQARYAFHGHLHQTIDYGDRGGVRARGVGCRAIIDLDGRVISPGD